MPAPTRAQTVLTPSSRPTKMTQININPNIQIRNRSRPYSCTCLTSPTWSGVPPNRQSTMSPGSAGMLSNGMLGVMMFRTTICCPVYMPDITLISRISFCLALLDVFCSNRRRIRPFTYSDVDRISPSLPVKVEMAAASRWIRCCNKNVRPMTTIRAMGTR